MWFNSAGENLRPGGGGRVYGSDSYWGPVRVGVRVFDNCIDTHTRVEFLLWVPNRYPSSDSPHIPQGLRQRGPRVSGRVDRYTRSVFVVDIIAITHTRMPARHNANYQSSALPTEL